MTGINPNTNLQTFNQLYTSGYQPTGTVFPAASLNNTPQGQAQTGSPATQEAPKKDTFTFAGKTIKKKTAIIGGLGILASAAAIGAAIVFGVRRGKTPAQILPEPVKLATEAANAMTGRANETADAAKAMTERMNETAGAAGKMQEAAESLIDKANELAENLQKEAEQIAESAQKKLDSIRELFNNGGKDADGKAVATIKDGVDDVAEKIMEEFADDGTTVLRRSRFLNNDRGEFISIDEFARDGKIEHFDFNSDGKLSWYSRSGEISADGSEKLAKQFCFNNKNGTLGRYIETHEELAEGGRKYTNEIGLDNGKLVQYIEGREESTGKTAKAIHYFYDNDYVYSEGVNSDCSKAKELRVKDGKLWLYGEDTSFDKTAKQLDFDKDGKISLYTEGRERLSGGVSMTAKELRMTDGKPAQYAEGCERSRESDEKIAKSFMFNTDGKPSKYSEGYEKVVDLKGDGSEKTAKELLFHDGEVSEYSENVEALADGTNTYGKGVIFKEKQPIKYYEDYQELPDGSSESPVWLELVDGKWQGEES